MSSGYGLNASVMPLDFSEAGKGLRERIARSTDVGDTRVLEAFQRVPREAFLPPELHARAYEDTALPIGLGQTISQPSMIALMLAELDCGPRHRVLEVGAGSGYVLALLTHLAREVFGVERHPELVMRARETLRAIGITEPLLYEADGARGLPQHAPYDRILVSAAAPAIPEALLAELAERGKLVMPVGSGDTQTLVTCERDDKGNLHYRASASCVFVPLVSDALPAPELVSG